MRRAPDQGSNDDDEGKHETHPNNNTRHPKQGSDEAKKHPNRRCENEDGKNRQGYRQADDEAGATDLLFTLPQKGVLNRNDEVRAFTQLSCYVYIYIYIYI